MKRYIIWLSFAAALLAGCQSSDLSRRTLDGSSTWAAGAGAEPRDAAATPRNAATAGPRPQAVSADYRLSARDQVDFEIFNEEGLKTTQRLSSRGELTLPLIGTVPLAGKTLREAEQFVRERYIEGGYYVDPQVLISVAQYDIHYVTVLGQVNRPSRIEMPIEQNSMGLVEAITQAGGFTRVARTESVQVTRQRGDGSDQHFTVDVRDFLNRRSGGRNDDFQLMPGDVVFVRERLI